MCNIYLDSFSFSSHISCFISSMLFTNLKWKRLRDSARMCVPVGTSSKNLAHQEKKKKCVCFIWRVQKIPWSLFLLFFNISSSRHNSSCLMSWGPIMCGCSFSFSVIHCRLPSPLLSVTTLNTVSLLETVIKFTSPWHDSLSISQL